MERFVYQNPSEHHTAAPYTDIPEFNEPLGPSIHHVKQAKYAIGEHRDIFVTERIRACSGIVFRSPDNKTFGLFHASPLPMIDLRDEDYEALLPFVGGQTIEIKGSESTPKFYIFNTLKHRLGIELVRTITADTLGGDGINRSLHLAFRPEEDLILLARNSHEDVRAFPGFL